MRARCHSEPLPSLIALPPDRSTSLPPAAHEDVGALSEDWAGHPCEPEAHAKHVGSASCQSLVLQARSCNGREGGTRSRGQARKQASAACPAVHSLEEPCAWTLIHDALRDDLDETLSALNAMLLQVRAGRPLLPWQVHSLKAYFSEFQRVALKHMAFEEDVLCPWLSTRIGLPASATQGGLELAASVRSMHALTCTLRAGSAAAVDAATLSSIKAQFGPLRDGLRTRMQALEATGLAMLRGLFTRREERHVLRQLRRVAGLRDLAYAARTQQHDAERCEVMSCLGVPSVLHPFLLPAIKHYNREVIQLVKDLQRGRPASSDGSSNAAATTQSASSRRTSKTASDSGAGTRRRRGLCFGGGPPAVEDCDDRWTF